MKLSLKEILNQIDHCLPTSDEEVEFAYNQLSLAEKLLTELGSDHRLSLKEVRNLKDQFWRFGYNRKLPWAVFTTEVAE